MAPPLSYEQLRETVFAAFPDLRPPSEADYHVSDEFLRGFAERAQEARGAGDWQTFDRCIGIVHRFLNDADQELEHLLPSGYLVHLQFDGPNGAEAWRRLPASLQSAWTDARSTDNSPRRRRRRR